MVVVMERVMRGVWLSEESLLVRSRKAGPLSLLASWLLSPLLLRIWRPLSARHQRNTCSDAKHKRTKNAIQCHASGSILLPQIAASLIIRHILVVDAQAVQRVCSTRASRKHPAV
jgi:hypothetical protein